MPRKSTAIQYDFAEDKVTDAGIVDGLGMTLMRLAAKATKPDYTGLSIANRWIKRVLPSERFVSTTLFPDTVFEFPYGDGYWGSLLDNSKLYSPDVEGILLKLADVDYAFIDCGANYGYMSILVTNEVFGHKPSIAIEADPDTYKFLQRNHELNDKRFEILNRAVFSVSGEMVNIYGAKHEARSILDENGTRHDGNVETIALDDLDAWNAVYGEKPCILKLDVEGVEIDTMKGATKLLESDLLVIFEDHASDKTHEVSRYFQENLGMRVFVSDNDRLHEIKSLDELAAIKKNPRVGYDFFGTKSKFWLDSLKDIIA